MLYGLYGSYLKVKSVISVQMTSYCFAFNIVLGHGGSPALLNNQE